MILPSVTLCNTWSEFGPFDTLDTDSKTKQWQPRRDWKVWRNLASGPWVSPMRENWELSMKQKYLVSMVTSRLISALESKSAWGIHCSMYLCVSLCVLTSASLDGLWLTSCLSMGASFGSVLRLLVSARVSRANLVHPAEMRHQTYFRSHSSQLNWLWECMIISCTQTLSVLSHRCWYSFPVHDSNGTYWSYKIFPQLPLMLATGELNKAVFSQYVVHIYHKADTMWTQHEPWFHGKHPPCRKCPWTQLNLQQLQGFDVLWPSHGSTRWKRISPSGDRYHENWKFSICLSWCCLWKWKVLSVGTF